MTIEGACKGAMFASFEQITLLDADLISPKRTSGKSAARGEDDGAGVGDEGGGGGRTGGRAGRKGEAVPRTRQPWPRSARA